MWESGGRKELAAIEKKRSGEEGEDGETGLPSSGHQEGLRFGSEDYRELLEVFRLDGC